MVTMLLGRPVALSTHAKQKGPQFHKGICWVLPREPECLPMGPVVPPRALQLLTGQLVVPRPLNRPSLPTLASDSAAEGETQR